MKKIANSIVLSASDLVGSLNCGHLTALDLQVATGSLKKPDHYDPLLEILRERGHRHESAYIDHLTEAGFSTVHIEGVGISDEAIVATNHAMEAGAEIIVQAALQTGRWRGRADILRRVETPSKLGSYSYEIIDTKLARETKGGTVLQLCLYTDLLEAVQGVAPEFVYVVVPWANYEPQQFWLAHYAAYYRRTKAAAETATIEGCAVVTYPDPKAYCDICRWQNSCDKKRRDDDHLCLVAGISKSQINELQAHGIDTTRALAELPMPLPFVPSRGSPRSLERVRDQAAIQIEGRDSGENRYVLLDVVPEFGFAALPAPSLGDVFFDIEGDEFVGEHGLEYLFGYVYCNEGGERKYIAEWAFDRNSEKLIFEHFIDFVAERRQLYPDMHVYHFAPYEPSALKRLMGRYASREGHVDDLLRGLVFVDLLSVTRNALRASVESYSLKKLEPFFDFKRQTSLHDANVALTKVSSGLELGDVLSIDDETKQVVASYNEDDCLSTFELRNWLESLREGLITSGVDVSRPLAGQDGASDALTEHQERIQSLIALLIQDVPVDVEDRSEEQHSRWLLAYLLEWHRREEKASWWELFRLGDLSSGDLLTEKSGLGNLVFQQTVEHTKTGIPTDRYAFEIQDTELRGDEKLHQVGGDKIGQLVAVSLEECTVDIKKSKATASIHPEAVFAHQHFGHPEQANSLFRLGEYVAQHGVGANARYAAAYSLLAREPARMSDSSDFQLEGENTLDAALRITHLVESGVLPIQGPPGTGKSFTGARMICEFIKQGKTVGITANSHKVIRNLIDKVLEAAPEMVVNLVCIQKPEGGSKERSTDKLLFAKNNDDVVNSLGSGGAQVAGATTFFWAREEAAGLVDVLVVDEAGQMSLADALAVSQAAPTLVLLGDPQQLEQPTQGTHPDGTGVSALDHLLNGEQTIRPDQGLFLETTYRLHPDICRFNSEQFYAGELQVVDGCEKQAIVSSGSLSGAGLRYIPVNHTGNSSSSSEEAEVVKQLVDEILNSGSTWIDRDGAERKVTLDDILIIAPYNAQVFEIKKKLPDARVGTVDKFQGQEAPIAIFSMATSSHGDAPRGMEFLYSPNRANVAISRAKCLAVLVASPQVFEADCKTPRQMQLANSFCRYLELCSETGV